MALPLSFATPRLLLRPSSVDDAPRVFEAWARDPKACRWLEWEPHASVEATVAFLQALEADRASGASQDWLAIRQGDGALIGALRLAWHSAIERAIGFLIAPSAWGEGYGSEIVVAASEAALRLSGVVRVQASCHPGNAASLRVLEKCGFQVEGRLRRSRIFPNLGDEPQDLILLARLA